MEALGPPAFNFCNKRFTRTDFTLRTKRGYNLECSHWEPIDRTADRIPVVIYMHGNSSARLEVIPQLSYLLSLGVAVFSFDFAGSGKSDGEYVSLGYYEREDLSCIVAHLRSTNVVSTIALWGRSMGAATALMFGDRDPSIACMILDSPFADLTQLCEEMVEKAREQGVVVPGIVASLAIRLIQSSVKKQAGFNIKNISPIAHADKCFIPVLFVAGEHDDFIKKHHSEALHAKYAGDKNLIIVEGDHNSPRPKFLFDSATIFLQTCMQIPNEWSLNVPISMNLMCPPWFFDVYEQRAAARRKQQQQAAVNNTTVNNNDTMNGSAPSTSTANKTASFTVEMGVPVSRPPNSSSIPSQPQSGATANAAPVTTDSTLAAATMNGYDHEEMGMTTERQRVIQASLFKMLGQADDAMVNDSTTTKSNK
jgi:pimeloyl-ACP methyl ester carboxylesterase